MTKNTKEFCKNINKEKEMQQLRDCTEKHKKVIMELR